MKLLLLIQTDTPLIAGYYSVQVFSSKVRDEQQCTDVLRTVRNCLETVWCGSRSLDSLLAWFPRRWALEWVRGVGDAGKQGLVNAQPLLLDHGHLCTCPSQGYTAQHTRYPIAAGDSREPARYCVQLPIQPVSLSRDLTRTLVPGPWRTPPSSPELPVLVVMFQLSIGLLATILNAYQTALTGCLRRN